MSSEDQTTERFNFHQEKEREGETHFLGFPRLKKNHTSCFDNQKKKESFQFQPVVEKNDGVHRRGRPGFLL